MAQSKNFVDHVKKELECSVCQEQFSEVNEPKILKCLHTFCKTCLEAWLRRQREGELSCPTCRQITECSNNINSLPSNFFYKQMVDIVEAYSGQAQETNSPRCGNCEEKKSLKFYCFDCNNLLCEDCAGAHKKWKSFRGHTFKEIGSFESTDLQDYARKTSVCKKHKDELRFYCERCKICICRDCAILDHRDDRTHNIISFEQALENKQSDITQKMQDVKSIGCRVRDKKESLEKRRVRVLNSVDQSADDVHRFAEHWISLIRQHESTMTKKLLEQKENVEAAFSAQMTGLDEKLTEINSSLEFGKSVLERKNLLEIVNVEEIMEQRFQDLLSSRYEFQKQMNVSGVRFVPDDTSMNNPLGKLFITNSDPSLSIALGKGLTEGLEGDDCTFMIITNDSHGQATYSGIEEVTVDIRSMKSGKITKPSITDLKNGRYLVTYKPETTGEFNVSITVAGETLKGSPFKLNVKERISTSQERKDVKRESSVAKRVLECSHMQEESKLKLRLFVPKEPPEVFQEVKACVNFETFLLSPQQSRDMLDVIKDNTKVAVVASNDSKDCKVFIVSGTFSQIEAAHKLLQFLINQKVNGEKDVIERAQTQQDYLNSVKCNDSTGSKAFSEIAIGRGRSNLAPNFQILSQKERPATPNLSPHLRGPIADSGRGRGISSENGTTTNSPPGLAVTEEGKHLAKSIGDHVTGDPKSNVDGSFINKNDVKKNESSSEGLKEVYKAMKITNVTGIIKALVAKENTKKSKSPPPLRDMQVRHQKSEPKCLMCMNFNRDLRSLSKCGRSHYYCESCIKHVLEKAGLCPQCDKEGRFQGNQPIGYMTWITAQNSLAGYEDCEVIIMSFMFHPGTQGPEHPNPGQPYSALYTSAFLPCNSDGKEVRSLLERAFNARLLFTIGTSPTSGEENEIIWNGIELKSNKGGGPASYGYPDPSYLDRVKKQLAEKGITQLPG